MDLQIFFFKKSHSYQRSNYHFPLPKNVKITLLQYQIKQKWEKTCTICHKGWRICARYNADVKTNSCDL